jgi:hypothetical protein
VAVGEAQEMTRRVEILGAATGVGVLRAAAERAASPPQYGLKSQT